jgi:hypothetical protein
MGVFLNQQMGNAIHDRQIAVGLKFQIVITEWGGPGAAGANVDERDLFTSAS